MTCLECGRWVPPCPETGSDGDGYCASTCEQSALDREDADAFEAQRPDLVDLDNAERERHD